MSEIDIGIASLRSGETNGGGGVFWRLTKRTIRRESSKVQGPA